MLGLQSAPVPLKGKSSGNQMSSNRISHCSETSSLQLVSFCGYKNHRLDCPKLVSMKLISILLAPKPNIRIVPKFRQFILLDFCWLPNQCIIFQKQSWIQNDVNHTCLNMRADSGGNDVLCHKSSPHKLITTIMQKLEEAICQRSTRDLEQIWWQVCDVNKKIIKSESMQKRNYNLCWAKRFFRCSYVFEWS